MGHLRFVRLTHWGSSHQTLSPFTAGQEPGWSPAAQGRLWLRPQLRALPPFPDPGSVFANLSGPVSLPSLVFGLSAFATPYFSDSVPFSVSQFVTLCLFSSQPLILFVCAIVSLFFCLFSGYQSSIAVCVRWLWL